MSVDECVVVFASYVFRGNNQRELLLAVSQEFYSSSLLPVDVRAEVVQFSLQSVGTQLPAMCRE